MFEKNVLSVLGRKLFYWIYFSFSRCEFLCLGIFSYLFIFAAGISCFLSEGARGVEGGAVILCSERALYMSHPRHSPLSQGHASHPILQLEAEPGPGSLAPMDTGHAWLILAQLTSQVASPGLTLLTSHLECPECWYHLLRLHLPAWGCAICLLLLFPSPCLLHLLGIFF